MKFARLGDVAKIDSGATPPRGDERNFGGTMPWAKIQDLTQAGMYLTATAEHLTDDGMRAARLKVFPRGTVLLAMYGSIGTVSIAGVATTTNQAILGIQCGPELLPD
jgi:type I restriction enzyme S subunit